MHTRLGNQGLYKRNLTASQEKAKFLCVMFVITRRESLRPGSGGLRGREAPRATLRLREGTKQSFL